ncbi:MAG: hypothetical protein AAB847_02395 [Patescibacteria group bacterium]
MSYLIFFTNHALRLLKKFTPQIRQLISRELDLIFKNPYKAPQLIGKFSFLRSWHVYFRGVPYRIIFEIKNDSKQIIIHLIAKRSEVYKLLERLYK